MDLALVFPGCHRRGGVERSVWELARAWSQRHDVSVYASEVDRDGLPPSVNVVTVQPRPAPAASRNWLLAGAYRDALAGAAHDHVVSFGVGAGTGVSDVLWVNSVHRAWLEQPGQGWRQHPVRRILPRHQSLLALERRHYQAEGVARVVVVADQVAADLERLYGVPRSRCVTVHNGYDPQEFDVRRRSERSDARQEIGVPGDAQVLLMVANELDRKGWPTLLEAAGRLGDPRLHVVLAGRTDPSPFDTLVDRWNLRGRVHVLGSHRDVGRLHAAADLFVLPTTYEAFCLAIVESLASGLPVVTTTVPGAGDLIRPGTNGLLQRHPRDAGELAALLAQALEPSMLRRLAAGAAPSVSDLTWTSIAQQGEAALQRVPPRREIS
jgi:UDP-glucose:(heptosyl)LPS alpha-1,3-glucosyltransferase